MLGKRKQEAVAAPVKRRRKGEPVIEEISFDFDARQEYLTGFHKRKLQRIKKAQDEAAKKAREDRIASRKALRESRKADLEKHVQAINAGLRAANEDFHSSDDGSKIPYEKWDGIEEPEDIDREDEYSDQDRHTTVTVEAVDVSREGLRSLQSDHETSSEKEQEKETNRNIGGTANGVSNTLKKTVVSNVSGKRNGPPKRKTKFRYEGKIERKVTRFKEKASNRAKAKARRR
ncbi:MAG: hypothetical protein Q9214_003449 [Letrouitia sp. 1 TL-2023]